MVPADPRLALALSSARLHLVDALRKGHHPRLWTLAAEVNHRDLDALHEAVGLLRQGAASAYYHAARDAGALAEVERICLEHRIPLPPADPRGCWGIPDPVPAGLDAGERCSLARTVPCPVPSAPTKPFPLPGQRWRFAGVEGWPPSQSKRVVELCWREGRAEVEFDDRSHERVEDLLTSEAWQYLGAELSRPAWQTDPSYEGGPDFTDADLTAIEGLARASSARVRRGTVRSYELFCHHPDALEGPNGERLLLRFNKHFAHDADAFFFEAARSLVLRLVEALRIARHEVRFLDNLGAGGRPEESARTLARRLLPHRTKDPAVLELFHTLADVLGRRDSDQALKLLRLGRELRAVQCTIAAMQEDQRIVHETARADGKHCPICHCERACPTCEVHRAEVRAALPPAPNPRSKG